MGNPVPPFCSHSSPRCSSHRHAQGTRTRRCFFLVLRSSTSDARHSFRGIAELKLARPEHRGTRHGRQKPSENPQSGCWKFHLVETLCLSSSSSQSDARLSRLGTPKGDMWPDVAFAPKTLHITGQIATPIPSVSLQRHRTPLPSRQYVLLLHSPGAASLCISAPLLIYPTAPVLVSYANSRRNRNALTSIPNETNAV